LAPVVGASQAFLGKLSRRSEGTGEPCGSRSRPSSGSGFLTHTAAERSDRISFTALPLFAITRSFGSSREGPARFPFFATEEPSFRRILAGPFRRLNVEAASEDGASFSI
jgi:hypothetical protein